MIDVISTHESKRRKRGEPVIIKRQIFFEGVVYQIEEELYSDSDHSSVYTSEDSFDENKNIVGRYTRANPIKSEEQIRKEKQEKDSDFFGLMQRKVAGNIGSTTSVTTPKSPGDSTPLSPKSSTDKGKQSSSEQSPVKTPIKK